MTGTRKYLDKKQVKEHEQDRWQWKAFKVEIAQINKRTVNERIKFYPDF